MRPGGLTWSRSAYQSYKGVFKYFHPTAKRPGTYFATWTVYARCVFGSLLPLDLAGLHLSSVTRNISVSGNAQEAYASGPGGCPLCQAVYQAIPDVDDSDDHFYLKILGPSNMLIGQYQHGGWRDRCILSLRKGERSASIPHHCLALMTCCPQI